MSLVLIVGGQKAGKSSHAAALATATGEPVTVVTPARGDDPELAERIARHRADRPDAWRTLETFDLAAALAQTDPQHTVLVDALDTWLAQTMTDRQLFTGEDVAPLGPEGAATSDRLVDDLGRWANAAAGRPGLTVVIAGEPGGGLHALGAGTRRYVDLHGRCLQQLAAAACQVRQVVAGRVRLLPDEAPPLADVTPPSWAQRPAPRVDPGVDDLDAALRDRTAAVRPVDAEVVAAARERLNARAAPPGALGELGELAVRLAGITGQVPPAAPTRPALLVAAGDHGVHGHGVSPWPRTVSRAIASLLCEGRAGASAAAGSVDARVAVLDVGLAEPLADHPRLVRARVVDGTGDLTVAPALTRDQAIAAVLAGAAVTDALIDDGADLLLPGDVGITNTTASAALVSRITGRPAAETTGPGTGLDADGLATKVALVERALDRIADEPVAPLTTLAEVGGTEHAAVVGMLLAAGARRVPVVLDGLVSDAAALVGVGLAPALADHLIAGHRSTEPGATIAIEHLGLRPLLDLDLALGEGSGALLGVPLVQTAARTLADVAALDDLDLG